MVKKIFLVACLFSLLFTVPTMAASSKAKLLTDTSSSANTVPYINAGPAEDSTAATALGVQVNGTEMMRVTASGNVGIGTTTPVSQLDLGNLGALQVGAGGTYIGFNAYYNSGWKYRTNDYAYFIRHDGSDISISTAGSGTAGSSITPIQAVTILSGGYVGIGTSPSYLLHVNGTAYAAGAAGALSDERHKKDVKALALSGLETIGKLRPVSFLWKEPKDDGMKGEQLGFIAQEVEKVLPQVVLTENNAEKTKGIKYTEIIPIMAKAIQELKSENDSLRARLEKLEARGK